MATLGDRERNWKVTFAWIAAAVLASHVVYGFVVAWVFDCWGNQGLFGDMLGGLNTFFSGLAFAGVIIAILIQREELKLQREELTQTREELGRAANAHEDQARLARLAASLQSSSALIGAYNNNIEVLHALIQQSHAPERESENRIQIEKLSQGIPDTV